MGRDIRTDRFRRLRSRQACCPECGYALAPRLTERCSECGQIYPGPPALRLRWGRRRLPIERQRHRALWPIAWLQTALLVTFRPMHSIRRLGAPDRAGSAILFAMTSIGIAACILSLRSIWFSTLLFRWMAPNAKLPIGVTLLVRSEYSNLDAICGWCLCTAAWAVMMLPLVPLGIAVANIMCRRRAAAFHAALRWSCYSSVIFVWFATATLWKVVGPLQELVGDPQRIQFGLWSGFQTIWESPEAESPWSVSDLTPVAWPMVLVYGAALLFGLL